jgi:hypothetical protein
MLPIDGIKIDPRCRPTRCLRPKPPWCELEHVSANKMALNQNC